MADDHHGPPRPALRAQDSAPRQSPGVLVAVTDHAAERFAQRVPARLGGLDRRAEITARVSRAWAAGRWSNTAPRGEHGRRAAAPGSTYVHDLVDRDLVFVCRHDSRAQELIVITLWEQSRLGEANVPRRFTDALSQRGREH